MKAVMRECVFQLISSLLTCIFISMTPASLYCFYLSRISKTFLFFEGRKIEDLLLFFSQFTYLLKCFQRQYIMYRNFYWNFFLTNISDYILQRDASIILIVVRSEIGFVNTVVIHHIGSVSTVVYCLRWHSLFVEYFSVLYWCFWNAFRALYTGQKWQKFFVIFWSPILGPFVSCFAVC